MTTLTAAAAGTWIADLARTRASFAARHLLGQPVSGTITVTSGTIEVGDDGRPQRLHATLDPASVDTGHPRRDADLRGKRFLAVDSYPLMEVSAERIVPTADGWYAIATLHARGHETTLHIEATLDGPPAAPRLLVSATAQLDLPAAGIRVPRFLVRPCINLSVSTQLTRRA